ncbi:Receptor-like serine/threonine-protein kinase [Heracleum sosnowskyi]|uniref:Receptor-like serine/threonine-protein kinase n=1 Tax=Heracleum sosnowskyi TaxID=360622 RepID=A0AAD8N0Z4_9APIA|nr:Receptor-like serine/threonine-protein kinase [Heracleum sosnowskyi]
MNRLTSFLFISFLLNQVCCALDTMSSTQNLKDGDTIVSSGGIFELGFFKPGESKNRYLGIWYKTVSVQTVVWVANREVGVNDTTSVLKLTSSGTLNLYNNTNGVIIWSSDSKRLGVNPVLQLFDNGNLVVMEKNDNDPDHYLWQSFDYPTDTHLPGMKLGMDLRTGFERFLSSWKSNDDPAPGVYNYHLDPAGYPHLVLRNDKAEIYQTGPWNGARFIGRPKISNNGIYNHSLVYTKEEVYYTFELLNSSVFSRFVLSQNGEGQRWTWVDHNQRWDLFLKLPTDNCDTFRRCGAYGICNIDSGPICGCLDKFEPNYGDDWAKADWSGGCVRKKSLNCKKGDGFKKYSGVKVPDTDSSFLNDSMNLLECETVCLKNCTCMAYTILDIAGNGKGCLQWYGGLIDIRELSGGGQDLYVRVAFTDSDESKGKQGSKLLIIIAVSVGSVLVFLILAFCLWKKRKNTLLTRPEGILESNSIKEFNSESHKEDLDLPFFRLSTLAEATNHFAISNKLGQGGFGPVFKGVLQDGQEIAVKCLSETSKQGINEFMNEVICIAKLQHRNLVRLLGYCVQGEEKMLIYEYMPNKSLDWHIFDEKQSMLLDWPQRFHIIDGIARGLLYLHQDSRLRIIHRDLKAGNILLDKDMNPKISDFGLARSFIENENEANTNRVVGTYGYMSPEYAVDGLFSVKSDVFSFGVLVLEIVSGRRNRGFIHRDHRHNLLGHAWRLHQEGRSIELIEGEIIQDSCYIQEVLRLIHIALLCVQQSPDDRPNMSSVVLMLGSEGELPMPTQPGFFTERYIVESEYFSSTRPNYSAEATTSTLLEGR